MSSHKPAEQLSTDDYFRKNGEFRVWLRKHRDLYFDTLDASEARKHFETFIDRWNRGKLSEAYYEGKYATAAQGAGQRTGFKWNFTGDINSKEQKLIGEVRTHTDAGYNAVAAAGTRAAAAYAAGPSAKKPKQGPAAPDPDELARYAANIKRKENRDYRKMKNEIMEELVPKETGREARIDKRRAERQAKAERSGSPTMREKDLIGADPDSFRSMIQKRKEQRERQDEKRRESAQSKISEHEQREATKMAMLLQMAKAAKSDNALWKG